MTTTATQTARAPGASTVEAPYVLRHDEGGIARLTLNRPERFNPLSAAMIAALVDPAHQDDVLANVCGAQLATHVGTAKLA